MMTASATNSDNLIIFDGGTGREIQRRGGPFQQPEWSALALYEDPDIVREIHESYIEAGATAITTNTYAVVPFHLGTERYAQDRVQLLNLAVELAVQARGPTEDVLILGSIPPICGSYEADKFDEAVAGPILNDFLNAFRGKVDVLLLETVGSIREAEFYLQAIQQSDLNVPVWLSFCMKTKPGISNPPHLLTGDTLTEAVTYLTDKSLLEPNDVPVVLVNCCDMRLVSASLKELSLAVSGDVRIGAYPNAFSIPPPDAANHTLRPVDFNITPELMKQNAEHWISNCGATVLGGCCGVEPDHIRAMASLKGINPTSVRPAVVPVAATTEVQEKHLGWSRKQGRILTANGKALEYYTKERGFAFEQEDLPHHHLGLGDTHQAFESWLPNAKNKTALPSPICGAWERPVFMGTWEHSTSEDETAFNVQTNTLFVDLRIPTTRNQVLPPNCNSLASLTTDQLRLYARQHVFGGYSKVKEEPGVISNRKLVCTRHHCIDWNYVGIGRPRPNKWWIEMHPDNDVWKEWAYATDDFNQQYYMERWERLEGGNSGCVLAMRKAETEAGGDGILVVVGNHFNYLLGRTGDTNVQNMCDISSTVDVVDTALSTGDRATAETLLSIDAGHGKVDEGWKIDAAIQPWKEGTTLITNDITVVGDSLEDCHVEWKGVKWNVYECSFANVDELSAFFKA